MQDHAAENDADQSEPAQGGAGVLRSGFGAPHEDQQKQESQMNANFDSEKTSYRDRPTAHRHAYQYSIYIRLRFALQSCEEANRKGLAEGASSVSANL